MSKVIVEICFPPLETSYSYILPINISVRSAIDLIADSIADMEDIKQDNENLVLYLADTGSILNETLLLSQTDVKDGSSLFIC